MKLGIIGTGGMVHGFLRSSKRFLRAAIPEKEYNQVEEGGYLGVLKHISDIEVVAICDPYRNNLTKTAELAISYGIASKKVMKFGRFQELLKIKEIDAVLVVVPNYLHSLITIASLKAGKDVLCEKPMATTVKDCDLMNKAARESGKILQIGLELRHSPLYKNIKKIIDEGEIGKIQMMWYKEFRRPFHKKIKNWNITHKMSGGSLLEKNCHHFDLFSWMIGARPVRVAAFGGNEIIYQHYDIIDHAWVIVEYENKARASLGLSLFSYHADDEIGAIGSKGRLEASQYKDEITIWKWDDPDKKVKAVHIPSKIKKLSHGGAVYYELLYFIECIKRGRKPYADGKIGKESIVISLAAEKAIKERRIVEIEEIYE